MISIVAIEEITTTPKNRSLLKIRLFVGKKQIEVSNTLHRLIS
jgi:hypothetical protein